jgi:hypothetical protein
MGLECCKCGGPADPEFADGLYDLCPFCSSEWDDHRLTPIEEEELFKDSPISLDEWIGLIVDGMD